MAPNQNTSVSHKNAAQLELVEPNNLIIKFSANLLKNPTVQKSFEQFAKISQPFIEKIDNKHLTTVSKWISQENVYNQLVIANAWLNKHFHESYSELALNFFEDRLDAILTYLGEKEVVGEVKKNADKKENAKAVIIQRIFRKLGVISSHSAKRVQKVLAQIKSSELYTSLDKHLHLNENIDKTIKFSIANYNLLRQNILNPTFNYIQIQSTKAKNQVVVILHGLNKEELKKNYAKLYAKYEVLQKCVVLLSGETLKLVFDKKALAELGEKSKVELAKIYQELKTLDSDKIKKVGQEYYAQILKKAQITYNTAAKAVEDQPKKVRNEEEEAALVENAH